MSCRWPGLPRHSRAVTGTRFRFHVAGAPAVGGGHMSRAMALAKALRGAGAVRFVLDTESAAWAPVLAEQGFGVDRTPPTPTHESGVERVTACIFDGYGFGEADFARARADADLVVLIDDLGVSAQNIDLLVRLATENSDDPRVLAGPRYALLDDAYAAPPARCAGPGQRVLLAFGLRDPENATGLVLDALATLTANHPDMSVTVALGADAPHRAAVEAALRRDISRGCLRVGLRSLRALYDASDIAVGGGGVSLLERMASGCPSLTLAIADNQVAGASLADAAGATIYLGRRAAVSVAAIATALAGLLDDGTAREDMAREDMVCEDMVREDMARRGRALVDGQGVARVAEEIVRRAAAARR